MNPLLITAAIELYKNTIGSGASPLKDDNTSVEAVVDLVKSLDDTRPFWKRKTFWATVVGFLVPILNRLTGLDMPIEEVSAAVLPLVAFIAGESWRKKA